ncbi:MAG: FecR domain-containing protein [Cyclobacteriaceae bacterium]
MDYKEFVLEDFLGDESFQNWRLGKCTSEESEKWEQWLVENPSKNMVVAEATEILQLFSHKSEGLSKEEVQSQWMELRRSLVVPKPETRTRWMGTSVYRYAAAIALLCVASVGIYLQFFKVDVTRDYITYHSGFGEKQEINLPDGSSILLNANSSLKTSKDWSDQSREVWLETGEAYFSIAKQLDKSNFVVHTDGLKVEVLGTQFNVNLTDGISVMLDEGSIKLMSNEGGESILTPGDLAEYNGGEILVTKVDEPRKYTAWLDNKISFDNTTLIEISNYVKRHYGVAINIPDTTLQKRRLSGEIPNDNLDLLLSAISVAMDLSVTKDNGKILIEKGDN